MTALLASVAATASAGQTEGADIVHEVALRHAATRKPLPAYPPEALSSKAEGVAVAIIRAGADGTVVAVRVLQAPHAAIASAMSDALKSWVVPPMAGSEVRITVGKVTVYFRVTGGKGVVLEPDQMPGNERVFLPPAQRRGARPQAPIADLTEAEIAGLTRTTRIVRVDLAERDSFNAARASGAINIPGDELWVRAAAELPLDATIVLQCPPAYPCAASARDVAQMGFARVVVRVR